MATLLENISRAIAVLDRMVANIETKGTSVPAGLTAEEQADKILDISSGPTLSVIPDIVTLDKDGTGIDVLIKSNTEWTVE